MADETPMPQETDSVLFAYIRDGLQDVRQELRSSIQQVRQELCGVSPAG